MGRVSRRSSLAVRAMILTWLSAAFGCMSLPSGSSLEPAQPARVSVPNGAWLAPATISDPSAPQRRETEQSLTLAIATYIDAAGFFSRVNRLPGNPRPEELVLEFRFDRYQLKRTLHPWYVPGAILSWTIYIWVGGPIYRDESSLAGELVINDVSGNRLAQVADSIEDQHDVSFNSPDYIFPTGMKQRTALVRSLLERAVRDVESHTLPKDQAIGDPP